MKADKCPQLPTNSSGCRREARACNLVDSHEFSHHVPGDELDGLWLVVQAQASESFPDGMLISQQHNGTVTLALGWGLGGGKDSLKSVHPVFATQP